MSNAECKISNIKKHGWTANCQSQSEGIDLAIASFVYIQYTVLYACTVYTVYCILEEFFRPQILICCEYMKPAEPMFAKCKCRQMSGEYSI